MMRKIFSSRLRMRPRLRAETQHFGVQARALVRGVPLFLLVLFLTGCFPKCVLIRSEYYDITGKVLTPKTPDQKIEILTGTVDRPYVEIGMVRVLARWGTSKEAINKELMRRARDAGADALTEVEYGEDRSNDVILCGKLVSTKRNISAVGKTIVFTDKKD